MQQNARSLALESPNHVNGDTLAHHAQFDLLRGLFLQRPGRVPLVQYPANGGDGGAPDGPRFSPPAGAPVGALCPQAVALLHVA